MNLFLQALKFFPYVYGAVVAVQQGVTASVPGAAKKQLIMNAVTTVAKVGEEVPDPQVQMVSTLIDQIVADLNGNGTFTHAAPVAAVAAVPAVTA